jgi:hypothetical protein
MGYSVRREMVLVAATSNVRRVAGAASHDRGWPTDGDVASRRRLSAVASGISFSGESGVSNRPVLQRAVIVRTVLDDPVGLSWSFEVDVADDSREHRLRDLLAEGWRVVHSCPLPSGAEPCCLLILERPSSLPADHVAVRALSYNTKPTAPKGRPSTATLLSWDSETVPMTAFEVGTEDRGKTPA